MIEVRNLTRQPIKDDFLRRVAAEVLAILKRNENLSVVLVGAGRMRQLNKQYRCQNRLTDVLAFAASGNNFILPVLLKNNLGEIIICFPQVKKQARIFEQPLKKELTRVLIHGILHLVGYNDEAEKDRKKMEARQKAILELLFKK